MKQQIENHSHQAIQKNQSADNIPPLRFPEFEGEWEKKKLGEVAEKINSGKTPLGGESVYSESGILFIRSQNVNDDKLSFENSTFISEKINSTMKNSVVKPNDILLNITGASLGRSCVVPEGFNIGNVNQHVCIIRLNKESNPRFVQPIFSSTKGQNIFVSLQTGSGREGLNFESIKAIEISFPTLPEQTKIATFLTAVDEKLQALKKKKTLLENYKKGVMQNLFSHQLRFKDENGNEFADWEVKKLGEIAEFKVTNSFSRENLNYERGTVKNIHYGDIHTKFQTLFDITKEVVPYVNEEMNVKRILNDFYCKEGDLVFADASEDLEDVGKSIEIVNLNNEKVLSGLHTILARPKENIFAKGFNGYLFKSDNLRLQIQKEAQGSKVLSISALRLSNITISIPSLPEQTLIANFLSSIDKKINHTQTQITQTETWKKGLLQKMFV